MKVGDRVRSRGTGCPGTIRYIGEIAGQKREWVGVEWDHAVGNYDGSYKGVRYFSCPEKHGAFVRDHKLLECTDLFAEMRRRYVTDREVDGLDDMSVTDGYLSMQVQFYGKKKIDTRHARLDALTEMGFAESDVSFVSDYAAFAAAAPSCHTLDLSFTAVRDPLIPLELLCAMPSLRVIALAGCAIPWASLLREGEGGRLPEFRDVCQRLSARRPFTIINDNTPLHRGHDTCWRSEDFRALLSLPGLAGLQFDFASLDLYQCLVPHSRLARLQASYSFQGVNIVELVWQLTSHLDGLQQLTVLTDDVGADGCGQAEAGRGAGNGVSNANADTADHASRPSLGVGQLAPGNSQNGLDHFHASFGPAFAKLAQDPAWREAYLSLISSPPRRTFQHLDELDATLAGEAAISSEVGLTTPGSESLASSAPSSSAAPLPAAVLAEIRVPGFKAGKAGELTAAGVRQHRLLRSLHISDWGVSRDVLRFLRLCLPALENLKLGPVDAALREFAVATMGGTLTRFSSRPLDPVLVEDSRRHLVGSWAHSCADMLGTDIVGSWLAHPEEQEFCRRSDVPLPARVSAALLEHAEEISSTLGCDFRSTFSHVLVSHAEDDPVDETTRLYSGRMVRLWLERDGGQDTTVMLLPRSTEVWRLIALARERYSVDVAGHTLISGGRIHGEKLESFGKYFSLGDVLYGSEGILTRRGQF